MSASLVGSEMCIRDSARIRARATAGGTHQRVPIVCGSLRRCGWLAPVCSCLLYTSDAADDM
eukprot:1777236-Alexandrium_andersonii.AAC.1